MHFLALTLQIHQPIYRFIHYLSIFLSTHLLYYQFYLCMYRRCKYISISSYVVIIFKHLPRYSTFAWNSAFMFIKASFMYEQYTYTHDLSRSCCMHCIYTRNYESMMYVYENNTYIPEFVRIQLISFSECL